MNMSEIIMLDNQNMTTTSDTFPNKLNLSQYEITNTRNNFSEKILNFLNSNKDKPDFLNSDKEIPDFLNSDKDIPDFLDYEIVSNFVGRGRSSCPQSSSFSAFRSVSDFLNH